ncbi:MAG: hypothetical protein H6807_13870 [Planctomycetes bacterium]|nr:hypothetical protein [Planctomycetota bacterium]
MRTRSGNLIKAAAVGTLPIAEGEVRTMPGAAAKPATRAAEHQHDPEIHLHKEGEDIVAIEVVCACGRTTFIECRYEN